MADLYAIYNEQGLEGLVPYALNENSHGYRILIDKIKSGVPLFCIRTQMNTPHIIVKDGLYQALFFTTEENSPTAPLERRLSSGCMTTARLPS